MKKGKKALIGFIFILIIYILISITFYKLSQSYLTKEAVSNFLAKTGIFAPIIILIAQILQILIAPIPVQPISIAAGYFLGAFYGFIIAYLGLVTGSFLAFYIGKKFGRPLVEKIISKNVIKKYDGYVQKLDMFLLTLIYFLPLFPDDEITYILGMSKIKIRKVILPFIIGNLTSASYAFIGAGLHKYPQYTPQIIFLTIAIIFILAYLIKKYLKIKTR